MEKDGEREKRREGGWERGRERQKEADGDHQVSGKARCGEAHL